MLAKSVHPYVCVSSYKTWSIIGILRYPLYIPIYEIDNEIYLIAF